MIAYCISNYILFYIICIYIYNYVLSDWLTCIRRTICKCVYLITLVYPVFCCCDLDLDIDPMTLIYKLDVDILKMYPHT